MSCLIPSKLRGVQPPRAQNLVSFLAAGGTVPLSRIKNVPLGEAEKRTEQGWYSKTEESEGAGQALPNVLYIGCTRLPTHSYPHTERGKRMRRLRQDEGIYDIYAYTVGLFLFRLCASVSSSSCRPAFAKRTTGRHIVMATHGEEEGEREPERSHHCLGICNKHIAGTRGDEGGLVLAWPQG